MTAQGVRPKEIKDHIFIIIGIITVSQIYQSHHMCWLSEVNYLPEQTATVYDRLIIKEKLNF